MPRKKKALALVPPLRPSAVDETLVKFIVNHPQTDSSITALESVFCLLRAPLTVDVERAYDAVQYEHHLPQLTPGEWCDLIQHQVDELRELEGAASDIDAPDSQARERFIKVIALSVSCVEVLDAKLAEAR
jgi:hypothetical protein